jgi:hypothetical protein
LYRYDVVVEHASRIEMLLLQDPGSGKWGPCTGQATTHTAGGGAGMIHLAEDTAVRRAAAAALLGQAGLGQPPDIEFMQALLPTIEDGGIGGVGGGGGGGGSGSGGGSGGAGGVVRDGVGPGGVTPTLGAIAAGEVAFVALVRAEHLRAGAGGFRGSGGGGGGSCQSRGVALETALRGASSGERISGGGGGGGGGEGDGGDGAAASLPGALARGLRLDVAVLRKFLDPWVVTTGKDPKAVCKDPRVAAVRAAGGDAAEGQLR